MDFARVDSTLGLDVATDPPVASSMGRATDPEWLTFYSPGRSPGCCTQMNRPLIIYPGCHGQRRGVRRRAVGRAFSTHRRRWLAASIDARQICQCRTRADQTAPHRTRPTARRRTPRRWPWHPRLRHVQNNEGSDPLQRAGGPEGADPRHALTRRRPQGSDPFQRAGRSEGLPPTRACAAAPLAGWFADPNQGNSASRPPPCRY